MPSTRITPEKKAECIRLRVTYDLSAGEISAKTGVGIWSVIRAIKGHAFYGRVKPARGASWTSEHDRVLVDRYATAPREELERDLPGHSWGGICRRASSLGIRRAAVGVRSPRTTPHPVLRRLRAVREGRRISREAFSVLTGYHVNDILRWENGKVSPRLGAVVDLAQALGYDVELVLREPAFTSPADPATMDDAATPETDP